MRKRLSAGFTLGEVLTAVAIVSILVTLAVPSFRSYTLNQRARTASYEVHRALTVARSEALKRNSSISFVPTSGDWTKGWSVKNGAVTLYERSELKGVTINGPASFQFLATGRVTAADTDLEIQPYGSTDSTQFRCIRVDPSGRPSTTRGACP